MTKKALKEKAKKELEYFDSIKRWYDHTAVYCVNVKRYNDYFDIDEYIKKLSKKEKEAVRAEFTDERINEEYRDWLDYEASYFIDDYLRNDCADSAEVQANMPFLRSDSIGLFGRGGGWFGVRSDIQDDLNALLYQLENYTLKEVYAQFDIDSVFAEADAIRWLLAEADKFNRALEFSGVIQEKIEDFLTAVRKKFIAVQFDGKKVYCLSVYAEDSGEAWDRLVDFSSRGFVVGFGEAKKLIADLQEHLRD